MPREQGEDHGLYQRYKKTCPACKGEGCSACDHSGKVHTGPWHIIYKGADGKLHREKVGPKSLAVDLYQKRKAQAKKAVEFTPPRKVPTVREAAQAFLKGPGAHKASAPSDQKYAARWIERIGDKRLDQVLPSELEEAKLEWHDSGMSKSTVNHHLQFLRRLYSLAQADGLVHTDPFASVKKFREAHSRNRWLTYDEEDRLRAVFMNRGKVTIPAAGTTRPERESHLDPSDFELIELGYLTGLREGDLFGLRPEQLDWTTGVATVLMGKTRAHARVVYVHLNRRAQEIIRGRIERNPPGAQWVFIGDRGQKIDAHNWCTRVLRPALEAAGIQDFTFRDLRHTMATRLRLETDADIADVADALGHSGLEMVRRYAHVTASHRKKLMEGLVREHDGDPGGRRRKSVAPTVAQPPESLEP